MTSFGFGEIGIVLLIALVFFDAKQVGKAFKWFREFKMKIFNVQRDFKQQIDNLIEENEAFDETEKLADPKSLQRDWAVKQVRSLPAEVKNEASQKWTHQIIQQDFFKKATKIAAFSALPDEINTQELLQAILDSGKQLFLPYVQEDTLFFCPITNLKEDLSSGAFGINEPLDYLRKPSTEEFDLMLIPGRCFDEKGNRLGRGKGYYDKYLSQNTSLKVGVCFDVQITAKKLNREPHDKAMDIIISEKRVIEIKRDS